jgi:MoaA/NifB/PqqE/SkfB family radical SAM enzyme
MKSIDKIKFSTHYCSLNGNAPERIKDRRVNIYVKIADRCNANCPFCVYANRDIAFNFDFVKFESFIKELVNDGVFIYKISFTGGEPTTNIKELIRCLEFIKDVSPDTFTVVNSNGYTIAAIINHPCLDNVSLSRHAIDDTTQVNLMQTCSIPVASEIKKLAASGKIHLTCNLIKGNIDSFSKVVEYLEFCKSLDVYDVGFVSLMKVNTYCERYFVDFDELDINEEVTPCNREWNCTDICKCKNYLYLPNEGRKPIKLYARLRTKNAAPMDGTLIYDGNNFRPNFGSTTIIR